MLRVNAHPDLPPVVSAAVDVWLEQHDRIAARVVEGLYVIGSAALDDWRQGSDIDVVVFVADPTANDVAAQLETAHRAYGEDGDRPSVDGPYLS